MKPTLLTLTTICTLLHLGGGGLEAQDADDRAPLLTWQSSIVYSQYRLAEQRDWRSVTLTAGPSSGRTTAMLELHGVEREGIRELAVGADLYQRLPSRGYLNLRGRLSPGAELLPSLLAAAELTHQLAGRWEGSAGYEQRSYPLDRVHLLGAGPGLYLGAWYLQARSSVAWTQQESALFQVLHGRRFIEDSPLDFVQLTAGVGREFVDILPGERVPLEIVVQPTWVLGARVQYFPGKLLGVTASAAYQSFEGVGARPNFSAGLLGRW
jgi:YaiO family outer membrane protein